ncbi:MAG: hypothetical protein M1819_002559 [Sarea resinae]|nr:MAG: hypothetical protein M1819_002559 [Sarea resinae]
MDVSGEQQTGVMHGVNRVRLAPESEGGHVIETTALDLHSDDAAAHLDPEYCGDCYGPPAPANAAKPGCCSTCDEVREAYASVSWAFGRGENVEQCEREGYGERLDAQRREGCRIEGGLRVNKVVGNFHIAPGRSFSNGNIHVHDLDNFVHSPVEGGHTFTHHIHHLRFGPQLPDEIVSNLGGPSSDLNPLDGTSQATDIPKYNYMYFVKVVSTSYIPLGSKGLLSSNPENDVQDQALGSYGHAADGSIETHQYSVTSHRRSLSGLNDGTGDPRERQHAQGGIPGVFFSYDISPMKVINREVRSRSFTDFLTGVCAVVGGTLTVAAAVDRGVYEGAMRVKKLHQG